MAADSRGSVKAVQYRKDRHGNDISILGFGCLRFRKTKSGQIDMAEAERDILAAVQGGINYFDTAYIYSGSEAALGEILERNRIRDRVYLADKLPHYLIRSRAGLDRYFEEQLRRLRTDRIDYYLLHMLNDVQAWERLRDMGILEWLEEKRRSGAIGQTGFSFHGSTEPFCRLLDAFDWDFCQIQYNYMDRHTQAGERGLKYAHGKGLPVIIMEPLRGGKLTDRLPGDALRIFEEYPVRRTPAQWGLLWLWSQPEVTCVLSGMNTEKMVAENVETADISSPGCITPEEDGMLRRVVEAVLANQKTACTGCAYCMPCPMHVDIPGTFAAWNRIATDGKASALKEYLRTAVLRSPPALASGCAGCGRCEQKCPQHIDIRRQLKLAAEDLEGFPVRLISRAVQALHLFG